MADTRARGTSRRRVWTRHSTDDAGCRSTTCSIGRCSRSASASAPESAGDVDRVYAAGAVCWRVIDGKVHVLVIHRTVYGDVTIPKGKVDPGESLPQTAVREIAEETGLASHSGCRSASRGTRCRAGARRSCYWSARRASAPCSSRRSGRTPRSQPRVGHASSAPAATSATSPTSRSSTTSQARRPGRHRHVRAHRAAARQGRRTRRLEGADAARPLVERGVQQAAGLVGMLTAWGPSASSRARGALRHHRRAARRRHRHHGQARRRHQPGRVGGGNDEVRRVVGKRVRSGKNAVICSHGPVLPEIMREIALATGTLGSYVSDAAGSSRARSASCTSRRRIGFGHHRDRDARRAPRRGSWRALATRHPRATRSPSVYRRGGSSSRTLISVAGGSAPAQILQSNPGRNHVNLKRFGVPAVIAVTAALALSSCAANEGGAAPAESASTLSATSSAPAPRRTPPSRRGSPASRPPTPTSRSTTTPRAGRRSRDLPRGCERLRRLRPRVRRRGDRRGRLRQAARPTRPSSSSRSTSRRSP